MSELERRKAQLDRDGYIVVRNALEESVRWDLVARLNQVYAQLRASDRHVYPGGIGETERLILNLHNKDEAFVELVDHSSILPLIRLQ